MLTYEELRPVLYHIARKMCNYKYEMDELINEVWLLGRVQKLSDIRGAYRRVYWDMVEYMRTQEGRKKNTYSQKPSRKYKAHVNSYNRDVEYHKNDAGDHNTYEMYIGDNDIGFNKIDFNDELGLLIQRSCNDNVDVLLVKLRLDGFTLMEIGKIVGVCESRMSQRMTNIGKCLLATIKSDGMGYNKKIIKELCMKG